jgi:hypothetical protein
VIGRRMNNPAQTAAARTQGRVVALGAVWTSFMPAAPLGEENRSGGKSRDERASTADVSRETT